MKHHRNRRWLAALGLAGVAVVGAAADNETLTPEAARVLVYQGIDRKSGGELDAALEAFTVAARIDPSAGPEHALVRLLAGTHLAETHFQLGVAAFNRRRTEAAQAAFQAARAASHATLEAAGANDAGSPLARQTLACCEIHLKAAQLLVAHYDETGDVDAALAVAERAEKLDPPRRVRWALTKADLCRDARRLDAAVAAYEAVLAWEPQHADARHGAAMALIGQNDPARYPRALEHLRRFLATVPATDPRITEVQATIEALQSL